MAGRRVVVLDQFEECFGSAHDGQLDRTVGSIAEFCDHDDALFVIGLRSDFFHRTAGVPLLLRGLQDNPLVVGPMSIDEVTNSIVEPPLRSGLEIAPDLLAVLVHEFGDNGTGEAAGNSLPLLSHALHVLVESTSSTRLTGHGANGYMLDSPAQRFYRDCKINEWGEGANELQREMIFEAVANGYQP